MNCVSENCKYVGCKVVKNDSYEYFKNVLVFYCKLGKSVSYPFIDDEKKNLLCDCYVKKESD